MRVVYSKGADLECPDALSRLRYEIPLEAKHLGDWATRLGSSPEMEEFDIQECFAVTRLGKLRSSKEEVSLPEKPATGKDIQTKAEGMTVKLIPAYADMLRLAMQNSQSMRSIYNTLKRDGTYNSRLDTISIPATCQYVLHDDLLYLINPKDKLLWLVLSSQELCKQQLAIAHDKTHCGFYRTFKRLSSFYWTSMAKNIAAYLAHCPACLLNKPKWQKPYGELSPITSPSSPFNKITIDLITNLPPCAREGSVEPFDTIMTVTDKFCKAVHFIPGRKDSSAIAWATCFYNDVVLNGWGFPWTIISDRDKRFLSGLWQALLSSAGVKSLTTTAYHPNADGQSNRTNRTREVMLRYVVNTSQSDWLAKLLPLQAACNNMESASTKKSPNDLIYGKKLQTALEVSTVPLRMPLSAVPLHERRTVKQEEATTAIAIAQRAISKHYDKKHISPDFSTGYAFLRLGAGYSIPAVRKQKLAQQRVGPFKILKVVGKGKAYRLQLPPHYGMHPVISVVHLEPSPAPGSDPYNRPVPTNDTAPMVGQEGDSEWEIAAIVNKRTSKWGRKRKSEYLVRWKGYGP